ncbi:MAG: NAD(P)/FAD-dependent oxidoreductase [Cytophagaceae bacterium]|nr:NAD(P)/FAD-dependent oxidoreductase [Cytophagaceae bacterium]MBK9509619.1 NAD(P)/FAD-dependent oxidoreductase [Cytophagaceae bacterium]MBK9936199.1 NAD(P)/FAD-dependent oxidoreductase [Cytophagaceae bacterium]MBL0303911.1 NAD(P)/FAD-dependent oxidoreductase [Cytophagaceae bacterium]MBL0326724.1 NAD(P)/FAD-dependent oxidoreductase [Cytophagaceae bacterium]
MAQYDLIVIGGGAAGFFAAINATILKPSLKVVILEKNRECLQKVKVSGGGRCNVTNAIENPEELIQFYPRGSQFLMEPFSRFGPREMKNWLDIHQVKLKTEKDGRVFPVSNNSQTIIDCFLNLTKVGKIEIKTGYRVEYLKNLEGIWKVGVGEIDEISGKNLLVATGSDARIWQIIKEFGHNVIAPIPSLFTFNFTEKEIKELQGISFEDSIVTIKNSSFSQRDPLLITHWGMSGPAILKLSSKAAVFLAENNYSFKIEINFCPAISKNQLLETLRNQLEINPKKQIQNTPLFQIQARFWKYICEKSGINEFQKWAESGKKQWSNLGENLQRAIYEVNGKSTFKEEFVTAGGVDLKEIDPENFASKIIPNLYFAGEVLNIDAMTGGFNFQAAWTAGWHVGRSIASV